MDVSEAGKQSFFEKKDQKTFAPFARGNPIDRAGKVEAVERASGQKFVASFFQKRSAFLLAFLPAIAHAHAFLESTQPRVGSTIQAPPSEVVLTFTQQVEPAFSRLDVTTAAGAPVETGGVHTHADDGKKLAVPVGKLAPGTYIVIWHATSVDTHKTQGKFTFTVAP